METARHMTASLRSWVPWWVAVPVVLLVGVGGCALVQPRPLDVPPGHRVVLGRVDLFGFVGREGVLEIVKEDGTFSHGLVAGPGAREFAIVLPPGRYRIVGLRATNYPRTFPPGGPVWNLDLSFEVVSDPAVYIGTLRVTSGFGEDLEVVVADESEDTIRVLSAWYPNLPRPIARALAVPR